ncbi:MAG: hypothetical protein G01um10148_7 [Parcubacteria group bacterium Gr01-1014_8]|nr:MAG: hypothetical protein G01um10148_7 [Parcubacteria group bacterium Gr01-1014_8]
MASKVILYKRAQDDFLRLSQAMRNRISEGLRELLEFPLQKRGIKKLKPPFQGYRKRVGDYRILFDHKNDVVLVRHIRDRKDAYR